MELQNLVKNMCRLLSANICLTRVQLLQNRNIMQSTLSILDLRDMFIYEVLC